MTKFEQVGVNYQYSACDTEQAQKSLEYSCRCCCTKGMHIECSRCAIAVAHNHVVAYFDGK